MNLFDLSINYLKKRRIAYVDRFVPYYICSALCHEFNLMNKERQIHLEQGRVPDKRLHMFFVGPPGYFKTLMLTIMLNGRESIFGESAIKTNFLGSCTEAAFVGTIKIVEDEVFQEFGAAYKYRDCIVGIDEFAAITNSMTISHSLNLDTAMLTALDSGMMIKSLALGELRYMTNLTLMTGSQPVRMDLSSGMGRRLCFIYFVPTYDEMMAIKRARREGRGIVPDFSLLGQIKDEINVLQKKIWQIEEVVYDQSVDRALDSLNVPHYEEPLFERLALGYVLATTNFDKKIVITVNDELKHLFGNERMWRLEIIKGAEEGQVIQVLLEKDSMREQELTTRLLQFGIPISKQKEILNTLIRHGRIRVDRAFGPNREEIVKLSVAPSERY